MDQVDEVERRHCEGLAFGVTEQAARERCARVARADDVHEAVRACGARLGCASIASALDWMPMMRLLKSWATPLASSPIVSSFFWSTTPCESRARSWNPGNKTGTSALPRRRYRGLAFVKNLGEMGLLRMVRILEAGHRFFRRAADHLQRLGQIFGKRRGQLGPTHGRAVCRRRWELEQLDRRRVPSIHFVPRDAEKWTRISARPPARFTRSCTSPEGGILNTLRNFRTCLQGRSSSLPLGSGLRTIYFASIIPRNVRAVISSRAGRFPRRVALVAIAPRPGTFRPGRARRPTRRAIASRPRRKPPINAAQVGKIRVIGAA